MDLFNLVIIAVIVVGVVGITLYMLNRSWGEFPRRAPLPSDIPPVAASASTQHQWSSEQEESADISGDRSEELILITHPMIQRAAEQALLKGGHVARSIVRQGNHLYFSFEHIADPGQREQARTLIRSIQEGRDVDLSVAVRLIKQIV